MLLEVFSILDETLGAYLPPMYLRNKGEFIRSFVEAAKNPESNFYKWPDQYTAYHLGTWDDNSAGFALLNTPDRLGKITDFVPPTKQ